MKVNSIIVKLTDHIKRLKILYSLILIIFTIYLFCLPSRLFPNDYSTVVFDYKGELMGARISKDGQWRFPEDTVVSSKFKQCLVSFEDQYFYNHPGVNPGSLFRALRQNIQSRSVVSGGSTITMQVIRLMRKDKPRNIIQKIIEIILASRLELRYSKEEILNIYASHAPFGGNVVGVQAASWRYYGRSPESLSWAEAALLAILPNSPSSIHPGKNRQRLIIKRNKLLNKLQQKNIIDAETYALSVLEPIPDKPYPLPDLAYHITERVQVQNKGKIVTTTLRRNIQENLNRQLANYSGALLANEIHNACALIVEVKSGEVIAYAGNFPKEVKGSENLDVDIIMAPRSTGSILKPILFAASQGEGELLPGTLIPDIPTFIAGFKPENYDLTYDGAVPAKKALARSLNIPCVRMLKNYGIPKFQNLLKNLGMKTLVYPPDHYGLTLIVGGAEGRLYEVAGIYYQLAYNLNWFNNTNDYTDSIPAMHFLKHQKKEYYFPEKYKVLDAGSIWLTFNALLEVNRPDEESGWAQLSSSRRIAWKTGTSYGFRDAWAVGTTPEYIVGVWVGNADGEGRPGLTGIGVAAPLLFQIFSSLPPTSWFKVPFDELERIPVCRASGFKAGEYCLEKDSIYIARAGEKTILCPYHKLLHLSADRKFRVNSQCYSTSKMLHEPWFILPPSMEWFYRKKNLFYRPLPPVKPECADDDQITFMDFIYPSEISKIFIPRELDGTMGKTVFEVAHRNPDATIYWHIDAEFLGTTRSNHQIACTPIPGKHIISVVDNEGRTLTRRFEIVVP